MKTLLLLLFLLAPQSVKNFDKALTPLDYVVVIAPPAGKTWEIQQLSFAIEQPLDGTQVVSAIEGIPGQIATRVTLTKADSSFHALIPIVGGYSEVWGRELRGQEPVTITHPARLLIWLTGLTDGQVIPTWTRAQIKETDGQ